MSESLFHILDPARWPQQGDYVPDGYATEGFVHCSYGAQVAGTANLIYRAEPELVVVELDAALLPEVRVEGGFPHVYGPVPVDAAIAVHPLTRDDVGDWAFSVPGTGPSAPDR